MKYDAMGLLANAARSLAPGNGFTAYALYEMADNLARVMRGEEGLDAFKKCYVGENRAPFIRNDLMPGDKEYPDFAPAEPDHPAAAEADAIERRAERFAKEA